MKLAEFNALSNEERIRYQEVTANMNIAAGVCFGIMICTLLVSLLIFTGVFTL